ncbi:MAG: dephospho-CoA kinase [Planctomycetes bacterium]|nr:dephospho-CoA kinase [Planctomycetota bacterium]
MNSQNSDRVPQTGRSTVYGILGGIASGKSAVARLLAGKRGVVIDADRIAGELLETTDLQREIAAAFGPGVMQRDGRVDREALGRLVFGSSEARELLESFTHPRIRAKIAAALAAARERAVERIVLDVPLLLENDAQHHLRDECDVLVFVDTAAAERDARAVIARGWKPGEVARREQVQLAPDEKRAAADHIIQNNGTTAELEAAVAALLRAPRPARR